MLPHKDDFINYLLSNNYSDKTLFSYNRDLLAFENFLKSSNIEFSGITRQTVDNFKSVLRTPEHHKLFIRAGFERNRAEVTQEVSEEKSRPDRHLSSTNSVPGLASKSINRMLSSLRKYLRYLVQNDFDCPLPPDKIEFLKKEKRNIILAELDEFIKLIECPEIFEKKEFVRVRNRAFLELLFSTGMRISEACGMNTDQIAYFDASANSFIVNEKAYVIGKGRKQRYVYLTPRCQNLISKYLELRKKDKFPALFIPLSGSRMHNTDPNKVRVSIFYFQRKILRYRKLLGIKVKTSAHSLRHAFATFMAEKGANVVALQTLLGHESLSTTTKYLHTSEKLAEETHKDFHPLNNLSV